MKQKRLLILFLILSAGLFTSCSTESYVLPQGSEPVENEIIVDAGFDETWDALISHASSAFFGIDNYERSSGLMTLSFSSDAPYNIVDCGNLNVDGAIKFNGNFAEWIWARGGSLNGRMNITAQSVNEDQTSLKIDSRYVLRYPVDGTSYTWAFDTNGRDTQQIRTVAGNYQFRSCVATGQAERNVIEGVTQRLED